MKNPEVTILIPNYKTPEITKLCLRLIHKHTKLNRVRVLVIDNDSRDESTDYLRSLSWIDLIERQPAADDTPSLSHSRALDLALAQVKTPFVLSFHTDTFVRRDDWLDFLLERIKRDPNIAGVGSWKLEIKPFHKRIAKLLETQLQSAWYTLLNKDQSRLEGTVHHVKYLRSHCALYRTDLLHKYQLAFSADKDTAGKVLHDHLVAQGHEMVFLASEVLSRYLVHLNHATMVLNPELGSRKKSIAQGLRRIRKILDEMNAEVILNDDTLDRID